MHLRSQFLRAACAAVVVTLAAAAPALAESSVTVQAPASATVDKGADVVYSGMADAPGTKDLTGTGPNMTLRTFYEINAAGCAPTAAEQRARPNSRRDGAAFIESPAPFNLTSPVQFPAPGAYRFCAYLEIGQLGDTAPPAAFAEAVVQVVAAPVPCIVPELSGLTLTSATKKLRAAGCTVGKVTKPRKAGKKKLVVRSQSKPSGARFEPGTKINLVLRVKKTRR